MKKVCPSQIPQRHKLISALGINVRKELNNPQSSRRQQTQGSSNSQVSRVSRKRSSNHTGVDSKASRYTQKSTRPVQQNDEVTHGFSRVHDRVHKSTRNTGDSSSQARTARYGIAEHYRRPSLEPYPYPGKYPSRIAHYTFIELLVLD